MPTLHIQHPVTDFDVWASAFDRLAGARRRAGVRHQEVKRPLDRPSYVVVDLDFDTTAEAQKFLGFLQTQIWTNPGASPALDGTPETMILETVATGEPEYTGEPE
jgi:hypothetical protein